MSQLTVKQIADDFAVGDLDAAAWDMADIIETTAYWSGVQAPATRSFTTRLVWSRAFLYVRFDARQHERTVVSDKPDLTKKTKGLWERDVCEIFVAPDIKHRNRYFEFEIAPTGEWVDLAIEATPQGRMTDYEYDSKMQSAAREMSCEIRSAIKVPFASLGKTPKAGDVWLGNIFRCVGQGPDRGYLSWQPTRTPKPDFHVPAAFGEFRFVQ
jgi:alpha-galactosidase